MVDSNGDRVELVDRCDDTPCLSPLVAAHHTNTAIRDVHALGRSLHGIRPDIEGDALIVIDHVLDGLDVVVRRLRYAVVDGA